MIMIKPCPICGQFPQIKRDFGYESSGLGAWCTIQCKPIFCKPHLKVEEGKATWNRALECAVVHWNNAVTERSE